MRHRAHRLIAAFPKLQMAGIGERVVSNHSIFGGGVVIGGSGEEARLRGPDVGGHVAAGEVEEETGLVRAEGTGWVERAVEVCATAC